MILHFLSSIKYYLKLRVITSGNQPPTLSPVPTFSPGTGTNAPNIPHLPVGKLKNAG
jgi:hypothetical protein